MVVDNCPSDLHRRLTEIVSSAGSRVSVMTIEYDIREDQPEGTEVFEMEPASIAMTETLVRRRFPEVSGVDASTIAEFSGGNARIAIALAGTVQRGESISGLADEELFRRLFHQNQVPDPHLLRAGEVCALVYSFEGTNTEADSELARLGRLARQDAEDLYARVAELRRRDLVQARSEWRAVLPHAVANRLAKLALQNIPVKAIETELVNAAPERLRRSFSRRLGYLHDSAEATTIIGAWLQPGGILAEVAELDSIGAEMFRNIAPVAPKAVLTALERALQDPTQAELIAKQDVFVRLLRSLAYEPELFGGCVESLAVLATLERKGTDGEAAKALFSLFFPYLSGTHATLEQRVASMEALIRSDDTLKRLLGVRALKALLEAWHFTSSYDFQFGSRSRDHGYHPNFDQLRAWYAGVLRSAEAMVESDLAAAVEIRCAVAGTFRGLWVKAGMYDDLERVSRTFLAKSYWREGWIAVRTTLSFDADDMDDDVRQRLTRLEGELRPRNLVERVRSIVLSRVRSGLDVESYDEVDDDDPAQGYQRAERLAEQLGEELIADEPTFRELLPEIISSSGKMLSFGAGLSAGPDPRRIWYELAQAFDEAPKEQREAQLFLGFIRKLAEREPELAIKLLSEAVEHPVLGILFPALQCSVPIDPDGVQRLRRSLDAEIAPIGMYRCLATGRAHATVSAADLKDLVSRIAAKAESFHVALEIVFFRLFADRNAKAEHEPEVVEVGRALLSDLQFDKVNHRVDHELQLIVTACLCGPDAADIAADLCERFKVASESRRAALVLDEYHDFFTALCTVQPQVVLDSLFGGTQEEHQKVRRMFESLSRHRKSPLAALPDDEVIAWCDLEPGTRYVTIACVIPYLKGPEEELGSHWSEVALRMMQRAPDPVAVARAFTSRFRPSGWTGSLAAILESRKDLLTRLEHDPQLHLAEFAREETQRLTQEIESTTKWEAELHRGMDQRFE